MKILYKVAVSIPLLALFVARPLQTTMAQQDAATPTPTYDPLVEPPLPPDPTEYELGRNLYWHWCMTCHGDRGQGLTDEFRGIWEPEHQNCWGRGCHSGRPGEEGFPIPTVVPALVDEDHLTQFVSPQELADFLEATHPPQSPGILKQEEYRAIALFVFTMNGRPLSGIFLTDTPTSNPTQAPIPHEEASSSSFTAVSIVILLLLVFVTYALVRRKSIESKRDPSV